MRGSTQRHIALFVQRPGSARLCFRPNRRCVANDRPSHPVLLDLPSLPVAVRPISLFAPAFVVMVVLFLLIFPLDSLTRHAMRVVDYRVPGVMLLRVRV